MKNNHILALSGNDIFSGGGLSADLATYTLNGLHGFVAVTCLTALTEKGFEVFPTDDAIFQHELDSLRDVEFAGIKIGLYQAAPRRACSIGSCLGLQGNARRSS